MAVHRDGLEVDHERIANLALSCYLTDLPPRGAKPGTKSNNRLEWTVLAASVLSYPGPHCEAYALISLATGLKCLPYTSLPLNGDVLHDQHAEVLARRGARHWLLQRLEYESNGGTAGGPTLFETVVGQSGRWKLKEGVRVHLYVSTLPCGDASSKLLEFQRAAQDQVAGEKDASTPAELLEMHTRRAASSSNGIAATSSTSVDGSVVRGRASSTQQHLTSTGSLRTKPGRPDSPPSICMSCSDKLALWNAPGVGIQGSLLSSLLEPVYIHSITVCDHPTRHVFPAFPPSSPGEKQEGQREALKRLLADECRRALSRAAPNSPLIVGWSTTPFPHSKESQMEAVWSALIHQQQGDPRAQLDRFKDSEPVTCPNSVVYISDPMLASGGKGKIENLATGTKMGAPTKRSKHPQSQNSQPLKPAARSSLCRLNVFQSFVAARAAITGRQTPPGSLHLLYSDAKEGAFGEGSKVYRRNKAMLLGDRAEGDQRVQKFLAGAREGTSIQAAVPSERTSEQQVVMEQGNEGADGPRAFKSWLKTPDVFAQFDLQGQAHTTQTLNTDTGSNSIATHLEEQNQ